MIMFDLTVVVPLIFAFAAGVLVGKLAIADKIQDKYEKAIDSAVSYVYATYGVVDADGNVTLSQEYLHLVKLINKV